MRDEAFLVARWEGDGMAPGILGTIQLAATLVFAIPVAIFGVDSLLAGNALYGGGALLLAVLMVALPHYLTTPTDVPVSMAERVTGAAVKTDEDDEEERARETEARR